MSKGHFPLKKEKVENPVATVTEGLSLGDRMKEYERKYNYHFSGNEPVICRVDGRSFSHFTKSFDKPVDLEFADLMRDVAKAVFAEIQCGVLAYTQSDEITFVIAKPDTESQIFFGGNQSKLNSIIASLTTGYFNAYMLKKHVETGDKKWVKPLGIFDCRSFEVPKDDAPNAIVFRAHDAKRNSILNAGRAFHSHKEMNNKNTKQIFEEFEDSKKCWEGLSDGNKFGTLFYRNDEGEIVTEELKNPSDFEKGGLYKHLYRLMFKEEPAED